MGNKLVGQYRGVGFDFYELDGYGGDFGEDGAAEGVGESEVCVAEFEGHVLSACLWAVSWIGSEERNGEDILLGL